LAEHIAVVVMEPFDPFSAPPPDEVPLERAPLVRVLAQVRFPLITSIEQQGYIGPFQERIRRRYPVLRASRMQNVMVGSPGAFQVDQRQIWQFDDADAGWRVSLAPDFVAVETRNYTSRLEFVDRLREILDALESTISPAKVDRLGIRYIDQIQGEAFEQIETLVRGQVLGIGAQSVVAHRQHAMSEALFGKGDLRLAARWGYLPAGGTYDPNVLEPVEGTSWVLDLDMFSERGMDFDVGALTSEIQAYAERIYTFFRWIVEPDFLRHYGGEL
jgi:uncharacterized protein (TIGR04255 family)